MPPLSLYQPCAWC